MRWESNAIANYPEPQAIYAMRLRNHMSKNLGVYAVYNKKDESHVTKTFFYRCINI